jgi:hypothetical protein
MIKTFNTRFLQLGKWFAGLFILMFLFRLAYGYLANTTNLGTDPSDDFFGSISNLRKNYASEKMAKADVQVATIMASNQKFEKTASVRAKSSEFERDQKLVKDKVGAFGSIIQYEQNLGQKGDRQLHLLIGVNPSLFDSFYVVIQKIGVVKATQVTKVDKTNEYRQLNAKKVSIEKTLQSLNELKSRGGVISDFVALNDKILEIEEKLQEIGVELGNFDTENEFCTVKFSLYEGATVRSGISTIHRLKVALEWTIKYYAVLVFCILVASLSVLVLLVVVDKLRVFSRE